MNPERPRCWSCWVIMAEKDHRPDGYECDQCGDEVHAAELEDNGWVYNGTFWTRPEGGE